MAITTIISDFDNVLSDYDVDLRLNALERLSGIAKADIYERIWTSGFETRADRGEVGSPEDYLKEFNERLGFQLTADQWIETRQAGMMHRPDMHELLIGLGQSRKLAMLTNNGPLSKSSFHKLAPKSAELFGDAAFFSCEFGTKKPDPAIFAAVSERLDVQPSECLFFDDQERHCAGAERAGMKAVVYTSINQLKSDLKSLGLLPDS